MLATIDGQALLEMVAASAVAGVGLTIVFSLSVYGATRFIDLSRDGRRTAAGVASAVAIIGLLAFVTGIIVAIVVMAQG